MKPDPAPVDLMVSAAIPRQTLHPLFELVWRILAGDLKWDCRRTLDDIVDALFLYAVYPTSRATARISPPRNGDLAASLERFLGSVVAAVILANVARAAPPGTRAFHSAGMADVSGWMGMAAEEVPLHTMTSRRGYSNMRKLCHSERKRRSSVFRVRTRNERDPSLRSG